MQAKELLAERKEIYADTLKMKPTSRVFTLSDAFTWKILDSDLKVSVSEATNGNWALMEKIVREHIERYAFDGYQDMGTRNNNKYAQILGGMQHVIDDKTGAINTVDNVLMNEDEYREYTQNYEQFVWCKYIPRKFGKLTYRQVHEALKELMKSGPFFSQMPKIAEEEYGVPKLFAGYAQPGIQDIFSRMRGIKEFSIDMRRRPAYLDEYVAANTPQSLGAAKYTLDTTAKEEYLSGFYSGWLVHSVMNAKQFARWWWPYFKALTDLLEQYDSSVYVNCEAYAAPFADMLSEVPKGRMVLHIELDDIFALRKALPDICIAGGMPVDLLGHADSKKCTDEAKRLIDGMGPGYIFSQNKMLSFSYDATRENMLATQDFVLNYKPNGGK